MIKIFSRIEKKYIIDENQKNKLLELLKDKVLYDDYCINGSGYKIYNIYFDSEDNQMIRHSTLKPYFKEKIRLRSYEEIKNDDDYCFLEIKRKVAKTVVKRRVYLPYKVITDFLNGEEVKVDNYQEQQVLKELDYLIKLNDLKPKCFIYYERLALISKELSTLRITFDKNIMTRRDNLSLSYSNDQCKLLDDNNYILEIKSEQGFPIWLIDTLNQLNIKSSSFSKYGQEYKNRIMEGLKYV